MLKLAPSNSSNPEGKETRSDGKEEFSGSLNYLVSLVGASVGFSDFWFPYLVYRNGGGAFLTPFILSMILCGLPLFFLEIAMSQFSGKGPMNLWYISPFFQGIGFAVMLISLTSSVYGSGMRPWVIQYLISCFSKELPWTGCHHPWNKPGCIDVGYGSSSVSSDNNSLYDSGVISAYNTSTQASARTASNFSSIPSAELNSVVKMSSYEQFLQYEVLELSPGLHDLGAIKWKFVLFLLIWRVAVGLCLIKNIKLLEKLMFVFVFVPHILMLAVWIRALTLDGAVTGILYYLTPDFKRLADLEVWIEHPLWPSTHSGLLGVSYMCSEAITTSGQSAIGMSIGFTVYPVAYTYFPVPQLWSAIFFITLILVGFDSHKLFLEVLLDGIQDLWPRNVQGWRRLLILVILSILLFFLTIPFCTKGGAYVFQLVDWYAVSWSLLFIGLIECFVFMWIYGGDRISHDLEIMLGHPLPVLMRITGAFLTPALILVMLLLSLLRYKPPRYGAYNYPVYAQIIGWFLAVLMVCPILIVFLMKFRQTSASLREKLSEIRQTSKKWGPNSKTLLQDYTNQNKLNRNVWSVFFFNFTGKELKNKLETEEEEMTTFGIKG